MPGGHLQREQEAVFGGGRLAHCRDRAGGTDEPPPALLCRRVFHESRDDALDGRPTLTSSSRRGAAPCCRRPGWVKARNPARCATRTCRLGRPGFSLTCACQPSRPGLGRCCVRGSPATASRSLMLLFWGVGPQQLERLVGGALLLPHEQADGPVDGAAEVRAVPSWPLRSSCSMLRINRASAVAAWAAKVSTCARAAAAKERSV